MKVCFLITGLGIGGAERHLLNIVPKLKFNKFIISLTNLRDYGNELEKKGIKIYYLGLNEITGINLPLIILRFRKIINREKPDIIDTYLIHANLFGRVFGKLFGIKKIISSMRSDYTRFKIFKFLDKYTQNFVDLYILNSNALYNYIHKNNRVPIKKIKIIPNGIDVEKIYGSLDRNYDIRNELGLSKESFIISFVGRLIKDKNISTLIKAMEFINGNISLLIIGDGPERKNLMKLTKKINLDNCIFFLGKRNDIFNIINSSNVFVLPSIREGMSNALLEAMTLKKICIVSNISQNRELIEDNYNGLVFNPMNERELANKIIKVYKNKDLRNFGQKSFKIIRKKYDMNKIRKKYENTIKVFFNL